MEGLVQLIAEKILQTLEGEKFAEWYRGDFDDYITGYMGHRIILTKEDVIDRIKELFNLRTME